MNSIEQGYLNLCKDILENGVEKEDRTGTGTISVFGRQVRYDLSKGFPLFTTKLINFSNISEELLWFINGDTNLKYLLSKDNHIWTEWGIKNWFESEDYKGPDMTDFGRRKAIDKEFNKIYLEQRKIYQYNILNNSDFASKYGELGDIYGKQWRSWAYTEEILHKSIPTNILKFLQKFGLKIGREKTIDQLKNLINEIKINPDSRRLILSAWSPSATNVSLPPCHILFQFYVINGKLSCQLYQRSGDVFLGVPYNVASYALLTHMIAKECGLEVGEFIHTFGDAHIYTNHIEQVKLQLSRDLKELPKLILNPDIQSIFDYKAEDISIEGYDSHPFIKAPVAV